MASLNLEGDGLAPARDRRVGRELAPQDHGRAGGRARLPHVERSRPLPGPDPSARRSGVWRCCRWVRRSRTSMVAAADAGYASGALGCGADLLPGSGTRRGRRSIPSGCPTRWSSSVSPTPPTWTTPPAHSGGRPPAPSLAGRRSQAGVSRQALLTVCPTTPSVACGTCWNRTSEDTRVWIGAPRRAAHLRRTARSGLGDRRGVHPRSRVSGPGRGHGSPACAVRLRIRRRCGGPRARCTSGIIPMSPTPTSSSVTSPASTRTGRYGPSSPLGPGVHPRLPRRAGGERAGLAALAGRARAAAAVALGR